MTKNIANALRILAGAAPDIVWTLLGIAGGLLIAYGAWLIYVPAGFLTGGVLLLIGAILHGLAQSKAE